MTRWQSMAEIDLWPDVTLAALAVVLLIGLLIVLLPVPTRGLMARPNPAADYAEALRRFAAIEAAEAPVVNPTIHSLLLTHGRPTRRVSPAVGTAMMNVYSRMPSVNLEDPLEPRRDWVYRGQTTRALAETLRLGRALLRQAATTAPLARRLILLTTARETQVANGATYRLAALWRAQGANVIADEFAPELEIPHNAIDPAADPAKKAIVYARMLELLGEAP